MIDQAFFQRLYDLPLSDAIRQNAMAFPLIESLHVLSITLVFGTILIVDLQLVGFCSHRRSALRLSAELLPFTWVAFASAVITGLLMFLSNAVAYINNTEFLVKMGLIVVAGLNMIYFHSTIYRSIAHWDEHPRAPTAALVAGATSLILWTSVIVFGRWIGFTLDMLF